MTTTDARADFFAVVRSLPDLVRQIEDPELPGLGVWNVGGLAGHLLRALLTPIHYIDAGPGEAVELYGAADYFAAYLDRRAQQPDATDASVAERGAAQLGDASLDQIVAAFDEAVADLDERIPQITPEFVVRSPFGGIRLDDYLGSRTFEATVHGIDLARAIRSDWEPPERSVRACLELMTDLAIRGGRGSDLLMSLTGRTTESPHLLR